MASAAANLLGQVVILWYVYALAAAAAWVGRHGSVRLDPRRPVTRLASGRPRGPGRSAVDGGQRMSSLVRVPDSVASLGRRALRWWPIGVAVAVIAAAIGLSLTWESPRVYVSRATVYAPSSVANVAAAQRYIADLQAAINSPTVQQDVADELGVHRSAFGSPIEVQRIRQSTLMQVVMRSRPLGRSQPGAERPRGQGREVAVRGRREGRRGAAKQAAAAVTAAEGARPWPRRTSDAFLREATRSPRRPSSGSSDRSWPRPGSAPPAPSCRRAAIQAACQAQVDQLQQQVTTLGQDADQLAALDRDLAQAESDVADANRDQRDADTAAARRDRSGGGGRAGGTPVSAASLLRRTLAILVGSLLLGVAVVVAIALLNDPDRRPGPDGLGPR